MSNKEIAIIELNKSFSITRENHNPKDFKTLEDFVSEYGMVEVQDILKDIFKK